MTASSIRRRSAVWTILLDWTYRLELRAPPHRNSLCRHRSTPQPKPKKRTYTQPAELSDIPATPGGIIPEWWARINRNAGRQLIGIGGRLAPELAVSVKEASICIVDDTGRIVREVKVASEPEALLKVLGNSIYCFKRIRLEAGPLSQWLFSALAEAELPVLCVETRHMQAVLMAQINKTDRNDARGIAQMIRVGLYRPVDVKTLRSQKLRMLLTHRKLLQSKAIAIENDLRGTLRNFGLKVGMVGMVRFEATQLPVIRVALRALLGLPRLHDHELDVGIDVELGGILGDLFGFGGMSLERRLNVRVVLLQQRHNMRGRRPL